MTTPRIPIEAQRKAVERLIAELDGPEFAATLAAARAAVTTLMFIERDPTFARALAVVMRAFPNAEVTESYR